MNGWDILLLVLIAAAVGLAVRRMILEHRKGRNCFGCGGSCEGCGLECSGRKVQASGQADGDERTQDMKEQGK